MRSRFEVGGRSPGVALDCLGVVAVIARQRGMQPPDLPADRGAAIELWRQGRHDPTTVFPAGWVQLPAGEVAREGDVLVFLRSGHHGYGIVEAGNLWTCAEGIGVTVTPMNRLRFSPIAVWRFDHSTAAGVEPQP